MFFFFFCRLQPYDGPLTPSLSNRDVRSSRWTQATMGSRDHSGRGTGEVRTTYTPLLTTPPLRTTQHHRREQLLARWMWGVLSPVTHDDNARGQCHGHGMGITSTTTTDDPTRTTQEPAETPMMTGTTDNDETRRKTGTTTAPRRPVPTPSREMRGRYIHAQISPQ
jgi:hypothetical protein